MTVTWRPSRRYPDRVHLLAADGRGRCGAEVGPAEDEPSRCALCVLLAADSGPPTTRKSEDEGRGA